MKGNKYIQCNNRIDRVKLKKSYTLRIPVIKWTQRQIDRLNLTVWFIIYKMQC